MDRADRPNAARRRLLCGAGLMGVAWLPLAAAAQAPRRLRFAHTHTGETLSVEYYGERAYRPEALAAVNHLLRDFRSGVVHPIDPALLDLLYAVQHSSGSDGTYEVISGYRSPETNALLRRRSSGVAEHSMHMDGRAIDVRLTGLATSHLHRLALGMRAGGVGYYARSDFVHLDTGSVRAWVG